MMGPSPRHELLMPLLIRARRVGELLIPELPEAVLSEAKLLYQLR